MTPAPSDRNKRGGPEPVRVESGLGVLCPDAQADGVPCSEIGRDCETCDKAVGPGHAEGGSDPSQSA